MASQQFIERKLNWWQVQHKQGRHVFYCPDCDDWTSLNEEEFIEAERCSECEWCGKLILNEVLTNWQCREALDKDYE